MLGGTAEFERRALFVVSMRKSAGLRGLRGTRVVKESFVPADGGVTVVARGLLFGGGISEGWGGGVANCISSRRTYVPKIR